MRSLPSLKDKRRYLVFEIISSEKHSFADAKEAVVDAISSFTGTSGLSRSKLRVLQDKWDIKRQRGILSGERKSMDNIKASLCLAGKAGENQAIIRSLGMSGILKKAIKKYY
ncbi:hypothetical protein HYU11_05075 [Candidatus Woesearchaeota archaeon]|nr:hypothetical protein [Candidatus Woesearchaeota archaeon]